MTQIVLLAVATSFIALWSKPENRDERGAVIEARAYRYAYLVLSGSVGTLLFASRFILAAVPVPIEHQDEAPFLFQFFLLSFGGGRNYPVSHSGGRLQTRLLSTDPVMIQKLRIRRLRFDSDEMTQQALADRVGVTRQTIIAVEAAKYSPSLELAFKIARTLGRPLEEVFQYAG